MQNESYKDNLTDDALKLAKQLTSNLKKIGTQLEVDSEVLQDTKVKQVSAKDLVEEEARDLKSVLTQVLVGNKRRKGAFLYIIFTYFVVAMVCRIF
ncbi:hypothetical protein SS50377_28568 [Spironucleus salmonicida]|uniref:Uncharacterized protein n=1 Tax=Spironucleus salmonicida TaxID=348837 RepID=V6LAX5_9EUKA|nr:hypothetical protein SS50377_28568 [Spironucleus salmonicida]|eukprot:EST41605.1 hypothetical protein SS50377_18950 [Spironucleus salmonicida]